MSATRRDNPAVVLVQPRRGGNVGAVARIMANFGFSRLILVKPPRLDTGETRKMALQAWSLIERAERFENLGEALAGFQWALATSCRGGKVRRDPLPASAAAAVAEVHLAAGKRVALVFGRERYGLTNEEVALCQAVAVIPTSTDFSSLNLAQAVTVFLWEISRSDPEHETAGSREESTAATLGDLEGMYAHLEAVLARIGYLDRQNPRRMLPSLKRILNRAVIEERDVSIVRGLLRQFDWYLRHR